MNILKLGSFADLKLWARPSAILGALLLWGLLSLWLSAKSPKSRISSAVGTM